ncbi:MAG: class I SAM-dependent methyltransferase [Pseudomonadota bacterium]
MDERRSAFTKVPASIRLLRGLSRILPNDRTRTWVYLNLIMKPRRFLRTLVMSFYRMDHIYDVIGEFTRYYKGNFSVLEFGVATGYTFTKMLYATEYLKVADRVTVHGFDSFEGMKPTGDRRDDDVVTADNWSEGQFRTDFDALDRYCREHYPNHRFHKGMFDETLTDAVLAEFEVAPPILVWIDCDYYTSARIVMERLIPVLPNGCVIYFDEPELNYGSRFFGESRLIHEINHGRFGDQIELVLDRELSMETQRLYRFINAERDSVFEPVARLQTEDFSRPREQDSPLP